MLFVNNVDMKVDGNILTLKDQIKAELGQFMTPAPIATFMASIFPTPSSNKIYLLDPGAGVGSLTSAFLARTKEWNTVDEVRVDAYEVDEAMLRCLEKNLESCKATTNQRNIHLLYKIFREDFIIGASDRILTVEGQLAIKGKKYTHCIMNPPYKKISSSSSHRKSLRSVGIETVNLYTGFVALSLSLLETNGYLVSIIPRSFCNGPYYRPFREYVLKYSAVKHIHLFASRNKAFKEDNVLQESVIIMLQKSGEQRDITISTSTDGSFSDLINTTYPFRQIVHSDDKNLFIHIPSSEKIDFISESQSFCCSLSDIGIQVSTGPVVDFRLKEHLRKIPQKSTVPLLYPCHFSSIKTMWPLENGKKPNAIEHNDKTKKWLFPNGFYTVVRRFSSKEEKRRIVASFICPDQFKETDFLGFENHLNVFHKDKKGISETLAKGLAVFLNSTAVDDNFRRFSGHTQVNATDLRMMKYPNRKILNRLGEWAKQQDYITTDMIDEQLEIIENGSK
jgi:adenine-specific DNA-methyltransferase